MSRFHALSSSMAATTSVLRCRWTVITDRRDKDVAARDHLPHQLPEDHIVRADQADVDHRDLIRVQPAQGRRDRIDGTAGRFAAADISGVELCAWRRALEPPGIADQPRCPHKYYRNQTPHSARARAVPAARAALTCRRCARYIDTAIDAFEPLLAHAHEAPRGDALECRGAEIQRDQLAAVRSPIALRS